MADDLHFNAEVMFMNDEWHSFETDEERWTRMRNWAERHLLKS